MNLNKDTDYLKLLTIDQLCDLLTELENKDASKSPEYELVLKELEGRK